MSLLDMTTNSRGMLIIGLVVCVFVAAGFSALYSTGSEKAMGSGKSIEGVIRDQENEIALNQTAIVEATKHLEEAEVRRATAKEADEMAFALKANRDRIDGLGADIPKLMKAIEGEQQAYEADKQAYRKQLLGDSTATTFAELRTISGKVYLDVHITSIDATSITLSHRDGSGRVQISDLPPLIRDRFP